jgi:hypothetical protein
MHRDDLMVRIENAGFGTVGDVLTRPVSMGLHFRNGVRKPRLSGAFVRWAVLGSNQ